MLENPFESGHIKNYILAYVSVVVIMILFFIASTLFYEVEHKDKKVFSQKTTKQMKKKNIETPHAKFKLMDKESKYFN